MTIDYRPDVFGMGYCCPGLSEKGCGEGMVQFLFVVSFDARIVFSRTSFDGATCCLLLSLDLVELVLSCSRWRGVSGSSRESGQVSDFDHFDVIEPIQPRSVLGICWGLCRPDWDLYRDMLFNPRH